jgi:hypothetical protein
MLGIVTASFVLLPVTVWAKGGGDGDCFAPWTPVLMGDWSWKPIEEIAVGDEVRSWDFERDMPAVATVRGLREGAPRELRELSFNISPPASAVVEDPALSVLEERRLDPTAAFPYSRLVLTADHPVYSVRTRGIVSHNPSATASRYNLEAVERIDEGRELLRGARGETVQAESRPSAEALSSVFTLKLDTHHWFFANGVLVHNKGGSFAENERAYHTTPTEWAAYVVKRRAESRQKAEPEPCDMNPGFNTTLCRWMTAHAPATFVETKTGDYVEATSDSMADTFSSRCACASHWATSAAKEEQDRCPEECNPASTNMFCRCDYTDETTLKDDSGTSYEALHPKSCFCDMSCLCDSVHDLCMKCLACEDADCVQDGATFGTETHVDDEGNTFESVSFCEGYIDQTFPYCSALETAPVDDSAAWKLAVLLAFWRV